MSPPRPEAAVSPFVRLSRLDCKGARRLLSNSSNGERGRVLSFAAPQRHGSPQPLRCHAFTPSLRFPGPGLPHHCVLWPQRETMRQTSPLNAVQEPHEATRRPPWSAGRAKHLRIDCSFNAFIKMMYAAACCGYCLGGAVGDILNALTGLLRAGERRWVSGAAVGHQRRCWERGRSLLGSPGCSHRWGSCRYLGGRAPERDPVSQRGAGPAEAGLGCAGLRAGLAGWGDTARGGSGTAQGLRSCTRSASPEPPAPAGSPPGLCGQQERNIN